MIYNHISVSFGALRVITGPTISYQYDTVQLLVFSDIDLPDYYTVDFCNTGDSETTTITGTPDGVRIPDELLLTGRDIKAYVVLTGTDEGAVETRYEITLPVRNRPMRQGIEPTPEERLEIETLVNALNDGVSRAETAADEAEQAAELLANPSAEATTLEPGSEATAEYADGVFSFGIPKGQKGDKLTYADLTEEDKADLVQGPILEAQTEAVNAANAAGTRNVTSVNTAGTTNVNSVNSAGTTQVNNVNQAGATQVQAVEDKGEEVRDSIPQDYTDLAEDVTRLNQAINALSDSPQLTLSPGYVSASGAISGQSSSKEVYTQKIYNVSEYYGSLTFNSVHALWVGVGQYENDGTFIQRDTFTLSGDQDFIEFSARVAENCSYIIFSFRSYDDVKTTDFHILPQIPFIDKTLTVSGAAADSKVTGDKIKSINTELTWFANSSDIELLSAQSDKFVLGGQIGYNGPQNTSNTRISLKDRSWVFPFDVQILPLNSNVKIFVYRQDGTSVAWTSDPVTIAKNTGWSPVIAYNNDAVITSISDLLSNCEFMTAIHSKATQIDELINASPFVFTGKKLSILGDSISTFAGVNPSSAGDGHSIADGVYTFAGNHCRYPNSYLSDVNDTYWKKLINALGLVLGVNDSWAGSRVSWNGSEGSDYGANIYIASQTRIGHLDDNGTPDYILVNAGTNDIGLGVTVGTFNTESPASYTDAQIAALSVSTFADAYRAMLIRLQKTYPLARIVVMLPNYTTSYYNPTVADQYLEIIKEACDYFGVPWIDMRSTGITMYNTGTYTSDGIHPNVSGMDLLYKKLLKAFLYNV